MGVHETGNEYPPVHFDAGWIVLFSGFNGEDFARIVCDNNGIFKGFGRNGAYPVGGEFVHLLIETIGKIDSIIRLFDCDDWLDYSIDSTLDWIFAWQK